MDHVSAVKTVEVKAVSRAAKKAVMWDGSKAERMDHLKVVL